jgi:hypothetical protein
MSRLKEYLEAIKNLDKDPEDYPFTVWRIVKDPYDIYRYPVKGFDTEKEAEDFIDNEEEFNQDYDTSFVIKEN